MEQYNIKNQAKVIRNFVNSYLDNVYQILQKDIERKEYDEKSINDSIREAIETFELHTTFHEELKQKISPLKVLILMLGSVLNDPNKLIEMTENIKNALLELENSIKLHYEKPELTRYTKIFDILYVEDNELERKTVDTYFKRKDVDIRSVETSEEGLAILKVSTPLAILLDIDLRTSNIDGVKLCQMLKSKILYKTIPIILISAVVSETERKNILTITQADDIIMKPIDKLADLDVLLKYVK
jgi:CheY-like chemotaxis protein